MNDYSDWKYTYSCKKCKNEHTISWKDLYMTKHRIAHFCPTKNLGTYFPKADIPDYIICHALKHSKSYGLPCTSMRCNRIVYVENTLPSPTWYASTGRHWTCGKCNRYNWTTLTREKVPDIVKTRIEQVDRDRKLNYGF